MPRPSQSDGANVRRAVSRLEEAVNDLVASAGESAAGYIERAAERVKDQMGIDGAADHGTGRHRASYRPRRRREPAWLWSDLPRSRKLYRDTQRGKLLGVCAGIGRYYGVEAWVVRCVAITGVIFLNWIVIVAYFGSAFVLDKEPGGDRKRSRSRQDRDPRAAHDGKHVGAVESRRYAAPSARQELHGVDGDFDEFELRLRRMETHVTSGRYDLQREFGRIADEPNKQTEQANKTKEKTPCPGNSPSF